MLREMHDPVTKRELHPYWVTLRSPKSDLLVDVVVMCIVAKGVCEGGQVVSL